MAPVAAGDAHGAGSRGARCWPTASGTDVEEAVERPAPRRSRRCSRISDFTPARRANDAGLRTPASLVSPTSTSTTHSARRTGRTRRSPAVRRLYAEAAAAGRLLGARGRRCSVGASTIPPEPFVSGCRRRQSQRQARCARQPHAARRSPDRRRGDGELRCLPARVSTWEASAHRGGARSSSLQICWRTRAAHARRGVLLPDDFVVAPRSRRRGRRHRGQLRFQRPPWRFDIGPAERRPIRIRLSPMPQTVLWNGPMGVFEIDALAAGTRRVGVAIGDVAGRGGIEHCRWRRYGRRGCGGRVCRAR